MSSGPSCSALPAGRAPLAGDVADLPIASLHGVGARSREKFARLGIQSVQDLLFHQPLRYEDRTRIVPIGELTAGACALVQGRVVSSELKTGRRSLRLIGRIEDGTGRLTLTFFNVHAYQTSTLQGGLEVRCFGQVREGHQGLEMTHPELISASEELTGTLTPVYPSTEGLRQTSWRTLLRQALELIAEDDNPSLREILPRQVLEHLELMEIRQAVQALHFPPPDAIREASGYTSEDARSRLAFEELLAHHLCLRRLRRRARALPAPEISSQSALVDRFLDHLPFSLTGAQQRVVQEMLSDLGSGRPMQRLIQGDVGSGKTVAAALCALHVAACGYQVAFMAPTELLCEQHHRTLSAWFEPLGVPVHLLNGRMPGKQRNLTLAALAKPEPMVVVGTHALLSGPAEFARLGLVIIDEQHRFGVGQRLQLHDKGKRASEQAHTLVMTATPIPRTLAMTLYADLDCSTIDELPPGRIPVKTVAIPERRIEEVISRVRDACAEGHQAFWVCPLIEASESLPCQAAEDRAHALQKALPELAVGLVHGRMKEDEKAHALGRFTAGETRLLVATTVIEVGVDVASATLMIIENAERLGLAQLHQLRGRVGRNDQAAFCVLLYRSPLSDSARARLDTLRSCQSGFEIAERDLTLRGPGEVFGTDQTGALSFRIADLRRDAHLIPLAQWAGDQVLEQPGCSETLMQRWLPGARAIAPV